MFAFEYKKKFRIGLDVIEGQQYTAVIYNRHIHIPTTHQCVMTVSLYQGHSEEWFLSMINEILYGFTHVETLNIAGDTITFNSFTALSQQLKVVVWKIIEGCTGGCFKEITISPECAPYNQVVRDIKRYCNNQYHSKPKAVLYDC